MKTKLTILFALVANAMSAQMLTRSSEALDTLRQTKFTAVYQYLTDPKFYMTGPKEILLTGGKNCDYQFVGGLFLARVISINHLN